jgi:hypothetical protein
MSAGQQAGPLGAPPASRLHEGESRGSFHVRKPDCRPNVTRKPATRGLRASLGADRAVPARSLTMSRSGLGNHHIQTGCVWLPAGLGTIQIGWDCPTISRSRFDWRHRHCPRTDRPARHWHPSPSGNGPRQVRARFGWDRAPAAGATVRTGPAPNCPPWSNTATCSPDRSGERRQPSRHAKPGIASSERPWRTSGEGKAWPRDEAGDER